MQALVSLFTELMPALSSENWSALTSPSSPAYHPLLAPLVVAELIGNLCFLIFSICLAVLFFQQRKYVPKLIISFLIANLVFVGTDYFVTQYIIIRPSSINMDATINLVRTATAGIVWIPYFAFSKRVGRTFVK
jgi:hypothetical protein